MPRVLAASWILVLLSACPAGPAKIEVQPERGLITSRTQSLAFNVTVKDQAGKVLKGQPVTFRTLTPTMATVDSQGNVKAVTSGTATILVEAGKASKQVEVLIQIATKILLDPENPVMNLGVTRGFKATVLDDRKTPMLAGDIRWESSDPEIFSVDRRGNVKSLKEGEAMLTVYAAGITAKTRVTVKHEELNEDGTLTK